MVNRISLIRKDLTNGKVEVMTPTIKHRQTHDQIEKELGGVENLVTFKRWKRNGRRLRSGRLVPMIVKVVKILSDGRGDDDEVCIGFVQPSQPARESVYQTWSTIGE